VQRPCPRRCRLRALGGSRVSNPLTVRLHDLDYSLMERWLSTTDLSAEQRSPGPALPG
jgi:hypothetical protein